MTGSLGSFLKTSAKAERDFDVVSSADVLTAAVYYIKKKNQLPLLAAGARRPSTFVKSMDISHIPMHSHMFRPGRIMPLVA